ncbi:putative acyltransferase [Pedobacter sp. CG_S7]|uniref:acyltransferase family protein n=1 Tax=Pedobacter sp. CG_S7 TaxID=3143930 RepID=UPI0033910245
MENKSVRLLSLDFFRGATVAAMILVNNPGDWGNIYSPLAHASWNGCTPTDLIFPFFLFIVGVSITYAMGTKKADPAMHNQILLKALKRALILFGLGLFLSLYPKVFIAPIEALQGVRIPGVLQRIGLVFFFSAVIFLKSSEKNIFRIFIGLLAFYWVMMTFIPVPNVGYANLEKETNLGAWIDRSILTEAHLWKSAKTWDPEGLFSTIPAIASGLFGVLVGIYLRRKDVEPATKIAWLFSAGIAAVFAGLLWDLNFPINKSLWTSSFVLYTGGLATMILAFSYWIIDVQRYTRFTTPFVVYGVNAITVFFLSGLLPRTMNMFKVNMADGTELGVQLWLYQSFYKPNFSPVNASLVWALTQIIFWLCILWIMYKKKIFIKV